jgi:aminopeptidase N
MKNQLFIVLAMLSIFFSCKTKKIAIDLQSVAIAEQILPPIKISPKNSFPAYRAIFPHNWDIKKTIIKASFNFQNNSLVGSVLHTISPFGNPLDSLILDSKGLKIDSIEMQVQNTWWLKTTFIQTNNKLIIPLPVRPKSDETFLIHIYYKSFPDEWMEKGSAAITEAKGLYFINSNGKDSLKPIQIWTQGETEGNSCWFPTIDKPNHKSEFELQLTVPKEFTTLSNGVLTEQLNNGNFRTDTWVQKSPMSAYLVMMAIGKFYKHQEQEKPLLPVDYYVEPAYAKSASAIFNRTPEMIDFFSSRLGVPFPWDKYSQIVCRDYVSGAMENTSASLFGEFVQKHSEEMIDNDNDNIVAHELFHQWFGDLVTCESWSNLFVNEAFASYGEYLWSEYKGNKAATEKIAIGDQNRYLSFAKKNDGPIVNYHYSSREDMFNTLTYRKGSRVLNLLRYELGDDLFFAGLKKYLTDYAFKAAQVSDLQNIFEELSGKDLHPFFNQWIYNGGHPNLKIAYKKTGDLLSIIMEQQNDSVQLFKFPISFKIIENGTTKIVKHYMQKLNDSLVIKVNSLDKIPLIIVDADHNFLGEIKEDKPSVDFEKSYYQTSSYYEKSQILSALIDKDSSSIWIDRILETSLSDGEPLIRLLALKTLSKNGSSINKDVLQNRLTQIAGSDQNANNRTSAFQLLSSFKNERLVDICKQGLKDSAISVQVAALNCLANYNNSIAYMEAKKWKSLRNGDLMLATASTLAKEGKPEDTAFYKQYIPATFGSNRNSILASSLKHGLKSKDTFTLNSAIKQVLYYAGNDGRKDTRSQACKQIQMLMNTLKVSTTQDEGVDLIALKKLKDEMIVAEKNEDVKAAWKTDRKME